MHMTPAEKYLWHGFLRYYPVRFCRNQSICGCIAAFYCARAKLAVALGESHESAGDMGAECFDRAGIEWIRFTDMDVTRHFANVCLAIEEKVSARITSRQTSASV